MKVLVVGNGGREHVLSWKISQSPVLSALYCAPGNAGTARIATNLPWSWNDPQLLSWVQSERPDLVVIGPEAPLAGGLADRLTSMGVRVFGPSQKGALLEASKAWCKGFMERHGVPTAKARIFSSLRVAKAYLKRASFPAVIKADGLAQGKGVFIVEDLEIALMTVETLMAEGGTVVIEEFLEGEEVSVFALYDGETLIPFGTARDYKRIFDGDKGANTGGMGAYSPHALPSEDLSLIEGEVMGKFVAGLKEEKIPYRGVLYFGMMLTRSNRCAGRSHGWRIAPRVLEVNVRFGDPEAQVVLPRLKGDLLPLLLATAEGRLAQWAAGEMPTPMSDAARAGDERGKSPPCPVHWDPDPCLGVVVAASGYPENPAMGVPLPDLARPPQELLIFHAGTVQKNGSVVNGGGRTLTIVGRGRDLSEAREKVYSFLGSTTWTGYQFRRDIGLGAPDLAHA